MEEYGASWPPSQCILHVLKTPQRRERFQEILRTYRFDGLTLDLFIGDDICWVNDLDALDGALILRDPIEDYLSSAIYLNRNLDEASLVHGELSLQDWDVLRTVVELLQPFKERMTLWQRKGGAACLSDIVPAYDELLSHMKTQTGRHSTADASIHILNSLDAVWILLNKYVLLGSASSLFCSV